MATTSTLFLEAAREQISLPELSKYPSTVDVNQTESQRAASLASPNALVDEKEDESLYGLHVSPKYLSERTRRPSALKRADSDKTLDTLSFEKPVLPYLDGSLKPDLSPPFTSRIANRKLSQQQRRSSLVHFVSLCWCVWLIGWNDGTTGPMLPRIQEQYNVRL